MGFGPTYTQAMGTLRGVLSSVYIYGSSGHPFTKSISAEISASRTRSFTIFISSSQLSLGSGNISPVMMLWVYDSNRYPTFHPAARNGIAIQWAKANDSWSFISTQNLTEAPEPPALSDSAKDSCSFLVNLRQAVAARSFSVSCSALAARSFACAALEFASATFLSASRFIAPLAILARNITTYSRISPYPIKAFAAIEANVSHPLLVLQNQISVPISRTMPKNIQSVASADIRSNFFSALFGSFIFWPKTARNNRALARRDASRLIIALVLAFVFLSLVIILRLIFK